MRLVNATRALFCVIVFSLLLFMPHPAQAQLVRVGWTSVVSTKSGQCIDIAGASSQAGAAAVQWPCQFTPNESWTVTPTAGGFWIVEQQTGLCLAASGSSVTQASCGGVGSVWTITASGAAFRLASPSSGLCLSPIGDSAVAGTALTLLSCSDPKLSRWAFQSGLTEPMQLVTLQANDTGQCMIESLGNGTTTASLVLESACAGTPQEKWRIVPIAGGADYTVVFNYTKLCLTAKTQTAGASLVPAVCNGSARQSFSLIPSFSGYVVKAANTSFCVAPGSASVASGKPLVLTSCTDVPAQEWSVSNASVPAKWTSVIPLNSDPIAVANLPNGTLLTWSAYDVFNYEADIGDNYGQTYYSIFNPSTLTAGPALVASAGADMFCPGIAMLPDGRVLINGGSSSPKTTLFSPVTGQFVADALMNVPRGYEGDTLLSTGSVFTLGGSWNDNPGGKTGEIWTSGAGWTELTGIPETNIVGPDPQGIYRGDNHLWLFALSQGVILQAGPSAQMNWIVTSGSGAIFSAGSRGDDAYSINGDAVMYDVGKILKAGGAPAYDEGVATSSAYQIAVDPTLAVTKLAPMAYARSFGSGVALPNGQVLIVGGQTIGEPFTDTDAVLVPELWDPSTNVFQQLAPMQTPRTYHSTAILLNDGRVFVGGGGQCGYGCAQNHFNAEILTPPYLLDANGSAASRPTITAAPANVALGGSLTVSTNTPVVSFALMRNSAITHTVNNDQRRIPLHIQTVARHATGYTYGLTIPADPGVALPGYYMLFALSATGTPSVAASIQVN